MNIAAMQCEHCGNARTCFTAPAGWSVDTIGGGTKSPKDTKPREARQHVCTF